MLKIAFRNLRRHKVFSVINILGLAIGMAACFLIFLYVSFEKGYDSFHSKTDRIYRIATNLKTPSEEIHSGLTTPAVAVNIKNDFPEVEAFVRLKTDGFLVRKGDTKFQEEKSMLADASLFKVFDFPLIYGNKNTALTEPMSIVLSSAAAKKYFGTENPVGQHVLLTSAAINSTVTGVMKDIPENSHIKADMFVSMSSYNQVYHSANPDSDWNRYNTYTYILLKPQSSYRALQAKLPAFTASHLGWQMKTSQTKITLLAEPLPDIYLKSKQQNWDGIVTGNINNVSVFSMIAVFILLIACVNFINLTTARSTERAKEVGIRKVVGAARWQLVKQFIGESVIISLMAFVFAVLFCFLLTPLFNQLAGKTIITNIFRHSGNIIDLFLLAVGVGIIAGFYPSLVLSSFKPVNVLKGRFISGVKGLLLRKSLVVFQFTISIILIVGTVVVYTQVRYMRNQDLGFNKAQTIVINTNLDKNKDAFKQSLLTVPGVISSCYSSAVPGGNIPGALSEIENNEGKLQTSNMDVDFVDYDYIKQYKINVIAGRPFSTTFATDSTQAMMINESALKLLGYRSAEEVIGKKFSQWGTEGKIIGVVKNFHFKSLQEEIKPLTMRIDPNSYGLISVKVAATNLPATIEQISNRWSKIIPGRPFDYFFLDEFFDKQYRAEDKFGNLFFYFAVLAIFISCLGLFGLASYSTVQRTKEIGVRKVLGASVSNIVSLLSRDFIKLILIAFVIASPVAWLCMNKWLLDFAYRTNLSWWMFVMAGTGALLIAFATISFQAIKAAVVNPVKSLRTE